MIKIIKFWMFPILWMGFIYYLSSFNKIQVSQVGWEDLITRKIAHMSEYCMLYILFFRALKNTSKLTFVELVVSALLLTFLYAASDEFHQTFVPGRTGKVVDVFIDAIGGSFGIFVLKYTPLSIKNKLSL